MVLPHAAASAPAGRLTAAQGIAMEGAGVGVLSSGSPRGVVMSRDSPRSERDGARNTSI